MKNIVIAALAACAGFGQGSITADAAAGPTAMVLITSSVSEAEVELDGVFAGNAPATLYISAGMHQLVVKKSARVWRRSLQVNAGSTISIYATPVPREPSGAGGV